MSRPSNRHKILSEGLKLLHARGFTNASVRDIVHAAGVPQGSFTNHFTSKEAFALEAIDLYCEAATDLMRTTLLNDQTAPLARLRAYIDLSTGVQNSETMRNGCLIGNFTIEAGHQSAAIRSKLLQAFANMRDAIRYCLRAAVKAGEIRASTDCDQVAAFIVTSMQGANLVTKLEANPLVVEQLKTILFSTVLQPPSHGSAGAQANELKALA